MKKATKKTNLFKKAMALAFLFTGLNQSLLAQCSTNFTYTTTASSISATNTSTGTTTGNPYTYWSLTNLSGSVFMGLYDTLPVFTSLYNGNYVLTLAVDSMGGSCSPLSQTITISGGSNAPACSTSFTYSVGASGAVNFTNTSPADALNNNYYSWSFGDGEYSYASSPTNIYYYNGIYTVSLNTNNNVSGCSSSSTQTLSISNSNTQPTCTSNFTYTVGASGEVDFTSLYTGSATLDSSYIQWSFGDNQNTFDSLVTTHIYAYNGTYSVTLYVNDHLANCYSSTTQTISITNTATQPCIANVTFNMHQDSLNPQPGIWEVSTYYSPQVTSAVWSWGDGSSTNGLSPTHTYTAIGQYNICVMAYASCGDSAFVCQNDSLYRTTGMISLTVLNVNNVTGIKANVKEDVQVSVYPNPSKDNFTIETNTAAHNSLNMYDINGKLVLSQSIQAKTTIDVSSLANGIYNLIIIGNEQVINKRVVVLH